MTDNDEKAVRQFPPAAFEEWFAAIEAGDGSTPVPQSIADGEAWHEHIGRRQIALGAWLAATEVATTQAVRDADGEAVAPLAAALREQAGAVPDRDRTFAAARFRAHCYQLVDLVEGPGCFRWQDANGFRLKDTEEWAKFYVAVKDMQRLAGLDQYAAPSPPVEQAAGGGGG